MVNLVTKKNDLNQIAKKLKVTKENRVDEKLNGDVLSIYQCSSPGNPQSISLNMRKRGIIWHEWEK